MGFREHEDWYRLTTGDLTANRGHRILEEYGGSPFGILSALYPDFEWLEWRFTSAPHYFWDDQNNLRRYLAWLAERLGFETMEDWYTVTTRDFEENDGFGLLTKFGSVSVILRRSYPEYEWKEWLFPKIPVHFWEAPLNRRRYLEWLFDELGFEELGDWYRIRARDFRENHGGRLLQIYKARPSTVVMENLPGYDWQPSRFRQRTSRQNL